MDINDSSEKVAAPLDHFNHSIGHPHVSLPLNLLDFFNSPLGGGEIQN